MKDFEELADLLQRNEDGIDMKPLIFVLCLDSYESFHAFMEASKALFAEEVAEPSPVRRKRETLQLRQSKFK